MIIGITGNIGSGKTTLARIFKKHGFRVISADKLAHEVLNNEAREDLKKKFGRKIFLNGRVNRKILGKIVFNEKEKLKILQKITWHIIIKKIKTEIKNSENKNILIDSALIIESGLTDLVDKLIVVKINKALQLNRLLKKGRYSKQEIENIIKAQLSQKEKLKHADYIINNSRSLEESELQVRELITELYKISELKKE